MSELASSTECYTSSIDTAWRTFLSSKGGEITNLRRTIFSHIQQEIPDNHIIPCTQEAVICFEGTDVEFFLQNQLTCDINELTEDTPQLGAYCNPKGRVLATFRLFRMNGTIYMVCHHSIVTSLLNRLQMFILRADVKFRVSSDLVVMYTNGHIQLDHFLASPCCCVGPPWPKEMYGDSESSQRPQLIVAPIADAIQIIEKCKGNTTLLDSNYWNLLQIRHGIASVTTATSGLFTPQNLNLDLISGVSFTKGCYPGQEIVARLRYLGRVKQRLLRGMILNYNEIQAGQPVTLADTPNKKAGVIVNVSTMEGEKTECLLSVYEFLESATVYYYRGQPNEQITKLPLPYSIQ